MKDALRDSWAPAGLPIEAQRDLLKRYGLAVVLAVIALFLRAILPVPEGTSVYQIPLVAVVLSAWFGGRVPGLLASLICTLGVVYLFVPPYGWDIDPNQVVGVAIFVALCVFLVEFSAGRQRVERTLEDSEQRLRLMAETVPEMLWSVSVLPARACYVTPRYEQMWGRPLAELPRKPDAWIDAVHPQQREEVRSAWTQWLAGEAGEWLDLTFRIVRPDGEARWIHNRGTLIRDGRGRPLRGSGIAADVTEERRAHEALAKAQSELARVSRIVTTGELTASIAHEVNQPLAAIVANAAACMSWLAAQPAETGRVRSALERIVDDGQRASLVIARIRALFDRQPPRKAPVDMNATIADVMALTQQQLRASGVVPATMLSKDLPPVLGDSVQLQQVLLNLIVNAVEAMNSVTDRPRQLEIASRVDGGQAVVVEVRDSGPGPAWEHADEWFEAFYTTKAEGLGIGLSISRSIVEAHGGRLWAERNAPHGAIFRFTLPAQGGASA
jgi:PAS domain S-box-containing protein